MRLEGDEEGFKAWDLFSLPKHRLWLKKMYCNYDPYIIQQMHSVVLYTIMTYINPYILVLKHVRVDMCHKLCITNCILYMIHRLQEQARYEKHKTLKLWFIVVKHIKN